MRRPRPVLLIAALMVLATGCVGSVTPAAGPTSVVAAPGVGPDLTVSGPVRIFLDQSLSKGLASVILGFERTNPRAEVEVVTSTPRTLVVRAVAAKSTAEVFIGTVGTVALYRAFDRTVGSSRVFGRDLFVLVTKAGEPDPIDDLAAFAASPPGTTAVCVELGRLESFPPDAVARLGRTGPAAGGNCGPKVAADLLAGRLKAALELRTLSGGYPKGLELHDIPASENAIVRYAYVVGTSPAAQGFAAYLEGPSGRGFRLRDGYRP